VKGYCSVECQAKDWAKHKIECEVIRRVLRAKTDDANSFLTAKKCHYQGLRCFHKEEFPEAEAAFSKALKLDPTNYKSWSNFGGTCLVLGHLNAVAVAAKTCIAYAPQLTYIHACTRI